ncbi:hypothetical protein ABIE86_004658 [Bradyrhizobium diazoefficiens]
MHIGCPDESMAAVLEGVTGARIHPSEPVDNSG